MRLPTIFISTAFMLAGMSAAFAVERGNVLVTRFADSDFLPEVEARAYDEPGLYARGCCGSKLSRDRISRTPSALTLESTRHTDYSGRTLVPNRPPPARQRGSARPGNTEATQAPPDTSRNRRSLHEPSEIRRRSDQRRTRNGCPR